MTLRTRLVLALVALSTVGLALFGVVTYTLYQRSLESRLDEQLRAASQPLGGRLIAEASGIGDPGGSADPPGGPQPSGGFGFDDYAALIDADGKVLAKNDPLVTDRLPDLPSGLEKTTKARLFTTGSASGAGHWRVLVEPLEPRARSFGRELDLDGAVLAVAVPTAELDDQMSRLLKIEVSAAAGLLTALAIGAWLVLRRGLRPLEVMAASASTITAGDLSERVAPAEDRTEVGQLGLALNTMLDGIEASFHEREETERRLRQFLADASHELRTPLTTIGGFAELFRVTPDPEQLDLPVILRRIEQESGRMKTLVEDLLLLARLDETRPIIAEPVDLSIIAADACTDAATLAPDRRVTLDAPAPVVVLGEADHLRQAMANLVTNALKHTPAGTPIEVSTRTAGGRATVSVRDHGAGLQESALAHAFDRFWQADAARVGTGAGLGLAIVAGIAEEHGGTATAANTEGGGATFTIDLPVAE